MNLFGFSAKIQSHFFSPTAAAHTEKGASLVLIISLTGKVKMEKKGVLLKLPVQQHMGTTASSVHLMSGA